MADKTLSLPVEWTTTRRSPLFLTTPAPQHFSPISRRQSDCIKAILNPTIKIEV
jgi:hypothetical protein